jgi:hypothetical protein
MEGKDGFGRDKRHASHAALELANLVVAAEVMGLEFPWIPSDPREASFVTSSLGGPTTLPRSFVRVEVVASWTHAVLIEEVRNDSLHHDSLMPSGGTQI